jgi:uncharacterized membrane protein (GlpM family)
MPGLLRWRSGVLITGLQRASEIDRVDYRLAIVGGLGAWLAAALAIFLAPRLL